MPRSAGLERLRKNVPLQITTPALAASPLLNQAGSRFKGSPQLRRGGAPSAGVVARVYPQPVELGICRPNPLGDLPALPEDNYCNYGLAAYLFTNDMNRILRAVRDMEVGELYSNRGPGESVHGFHAGWKQSGVGGDAGKYGLEEYLQRKTVYIPYQG